MAATKETIEIFDKLTGQSVGVFFADTLRFIEVDYPVLLSYYKGETKNVPAVQLENLSRLRDRLDDINSDIQLYADSLDNLRFWDLIEQLEGIQAQLDNINNLARWLRVSKYIGSFNTNPSKTLALKQGESLERFTKRTGDQDYNNSWVNIALTNQLAEEGYELDGGQLLSISFDDIFIPEVRGVVDIIEGENIYGRDVDRAFTFVDDDLKTVFGNDCFMQAVKILFALKRGDNPEYLNQGINPKLVAGSNVNSVNLPIIIRQIGELFSTDDTISGIQVNKLERDQDAVFLEAEISGRAGDIEQLTSQVG